MSTDLQDRITAARREAAGVKEKIKRKKDDLADADRKFYLFYLFFSPLPHTALSRP